MKEAEYIQECFDKDWEVLNYCNPAFVATTPKEVAQCVFKSIEELKAKRQSEFCYSRTGFFFYIIDWVRFRKRKVLISFCVKKDFRTAYYLLSFWRDIVEILGKHFYAYMNTTNERAIKWLVKCGMQIISKNDLLTILYI